MGLPARALHQRDRQNARQPQDPRGGLAALRLALHGRSGRSHDAWRRVIRRRREERGKSKSDHERLHI